MAQKIAWLPPAIEHSLLTLTHPSQGFRPAWLAPGVPGQVLVVTESGALGWAVPAPSGITNPMTDLGDLIVGEVDGVPARLGVGLPGQVLQSLNGVPTWARMPELRSGNWTWRTTHAQPTPSGMVSVNSPSASTALFLSAMTADGVDATTVLDDLEVGDRLYVQDIDDATRYVHVEIVSGAGTFVSNTLTLGVIAHGPQGLAIADGRPVRVVGAFFGATSGIGGGGMTNPMTTLGDLIVGSTDGFPARLGVADAGDVLTLVGGVPAWQAPVPSGMTNPMTAPGDLILGGASGTPTRLPQGTAGHVLMMNGGPHWAALPPDVGFANPMTSAGDMILGGASGAPSRLAIGSNTHVLTVVGGVPTWQAPAASGMTNPMTTPADLIVGGIGGAPSRLGVGGNTQVLTVSSGSLVWATPAAPGMTNPMTTPADLIVGAAGGTPARLAKGADTQVLTVVAGALAWATPASGGMTNPMTASGDVIVGGASGTPTRLAKGTDTHVLTLVAGLPAWAVAPGSGGGMTNPMTAVGDVIVGSTAGAPIRLGAGTNGHVLTLVGGTPAWTVLPTDIGFANPMTATGDLIRGGASGVATRLAKGTDGQWLTLVAGLPAWGTLPVDPGFANPMTGVGDLIRGGTSGAPTRLAPGANGTWLTLTAGVPTWTTLPIDPGFANPMTTQHDLIVGGASGVPARLAKGADNLVLKVTAGAVGWAADVGFANPMIAVGDLIIGTTAGAPLRLGVGTNGHVLTLVAGSPAWQAAAGGVSYPLLAPNGSSSAPSYSFASETALGFYRSGAGQLVAQIPSGGIFAVSGPANSFVISELSINPSIDGVGSLGAETFRLSEAWFKSHLTLASLGAAPTTPPTGHVRVYSKTDKRLYQKDDAGLETPLTNPTTPIMIMLPLEGARFPDGSGAGLNLFPQPVERISTTAAGSTPKIVTLVYQFDQATISTSAEFLMWKIATPLDYAGGVVTLVTKWSMVSATSGNFRTTGALAPVIDNSTDVRALVFNAVTTSADVAVPTTLGQQKEARITLDATNVATGRYAIVLVGMWPATATNATGDRVLEAAWLEFAR